jgi:uncharacterized YigZ family protein
LTHFPRPELGIPSKCESAGSLVSGTYVRTIAADARIELEVRKSRFIGHAFRVNDEDAARSRIQDLRKHHWEANHNCTAWRIGADGRSQRSNDDGEPSGTAGIPMLEVLNQRNLTDVLVVVTRYFGGTKLGAGGLIRAYGSTVSAVLDIAGVVERRPMHRVVALVDHGGAGRFESLLRATEFGLAGVEYTATGVEAALHLAPETMTPFATWVAEVTTGAGVVVDTGTFEIDVPVTE